MRKNFPVKEVLTRQKSILYNLIHKKKRILFDNLGGSSNENL